MVCNRLDGGRGIEVQVQVFCRIDIQFDSGKDLVVQFVITDGVDQPIRVIAVACGK